MLDIHDYNCQLTVEEAGLTEGRSTPTGSVTRPLHTCVILTRPRDWFADIDFTDPAAATARIAAEFDGWVPELTSLITDGDTPPILRPLFGLPVGHRWDRLPRVTLAHLAPPGR